MHHARLFLAFSAAAALGAFIAACGTPVVKCSPASCAGCCDAAGACQAGGSNSSCGAQGNGCVSCQAGTNCEFGVCRTSSTNGGGGGTMGGGGGTTGGGGGTTGGGTGGGVTGGGTGGGVTGGGTGGGVTGGGTGGGVTGGGTGGGVTGGGTGGGAAPMFDAGTVIRPDGGALNPPTITLTFMPNCGNVNACPGNEVDAWAYSTGCIDDSAFSRVTSAAMNVGCTANISNKNGSIAGSVVFDGTSVHRTVVGEVNFTLTAGPPCNNVCSFIPGQLASFGITGTCAVALTDCVCQLTFPLAQNGSQSYTYVGGLLTAQRAMGGPETYNSCITGSSLQYRETTDGGIPGVFTLTK